MDVTVRLFAVYDMIWYDMVCYLYAVNGFPHGCSGRYTCTKIGKRQLCTKGETMHKTIKNTEHTK